MGGAARPVLLALALGALAVGCGGNDDAGDNASKAPTTSGSPSEAGNGQAERFKAEAMAEMRELSRRACGSIPPNVLARELGDNRVPGLATEPNDIALGYVRDVDINPIPLQRAAYDGCVLGLESNDPGDTTAKPLPPGNAHGVARLESCDTTDPKLFPKGGGFDVQTQGMTCEELGEIFHQFGLPISNADPHEGVFERGPWTCWAQFLDEPHGPVQNVCWDESGRLLVYKVG